MYFFFHQFVGGNAGSFWSLWLLKTLTLCFHTKLLLSMVVCLCFTGETYIRWYSETLRKELFPLSHADFICTLMFALLTGRHLWTQLSHNHSVSHQHRHWQWLGRFCSFFRLCLCPELLIGLRIRMIFICHLPNYSLVMFFIDHHVRNGHYNFLVCKFA